MKPQIFTLVDGDADEWLISAALDLGETVVVLSVSPVPLPVMQRAPRKGAIRAIQIWDEVLAQTDFIGVAQVLGAAVSHVAGGQSTPFLVLAGDRGRGAVGPGVAERLAVPHLSAVRQLTWRDDRLVAERPTKGLSRHYAVPIPSVICLSQRARPPALEESPPRSAESVSLADVGVSPRDLRFRKRFRSLPASGPERWPRVMQEAGALVDRLRAEGLLGRQR